MMGQWVYTLVTWLSAQMLIVSATQSGWRPIKSRPDFIIGPHLRYTSKNKIPMPTIANPCSLYKAVMDQHSFYQYVQYKHHIPDMKEFTLCAWHKLYNHSTDHPIFSYSQLHKQRAIYSWIMNTPKKSYYMLAINGHTIYRINYPIKLHKWYHMCQSWNGKTGEWQLWVNGERTGRGYYNLMVGKIIKSGGIAISGQEKVDTSGTYWKGKGGGLQGEITLLQLYKAALTKGKAYSDHKHHHVHEWGHDGEPMNDDDENTSEMYPTQEPEPTTSEHPFLENGQLKPRLPVHELLAKGTLKPTYPLDILSAFGNYHPGSIFKLDEPVSYENGFENKYRIFRRNYDDRISPIARMGRRRRMRRFVNGTINKIDRRFTREYDHPADSKYTAESSFRKLLHFPLQNYIPQNKRALVIPDHFSPDSALPNLYSELNGHNILVDDPTSFFKNIIADSGETKIEYEPAEWEVKKIAEVCSACDEDPFKKANVLSWQETPKKLFAGAEYVPAVPKCHIF